MRGHNNPNPSTKAQSTDESFSNSKVSQNPNFVKSKLSLGNGNASSKDVFALAKESRLAESYNEKARRGQSFEADLSKYDSKQQDVIKKAVESGVLNNTNRTH